MSIEYYVFALFIAILVCVVAIVFKVLFSNVKKQNELLDERERKILELYNSVETLTEEFQDQLKAATDELSLREQEYRAAMKDLASFQSVFQLPPELERKEQVIEKLPRSLPLDAGRIRAAGDVIERAERLVMHEPVPPPPATHATDYVQPATYTPPPPEPPAPASFSPFKKFFDDAAEAPPPTPYSPASISGGSRKDKILAMYNEGKSDVEIAKQLNITRNEVQLVVGLTR